VRDQHKKFRVKLPRVFYTFVFNRKSLHSVNIEMSRRLLLVVRKCVNMITMVA
jgi:hypothetical protein